MKPWTYAYAAFMAAGGAMAYAKAKSTKSLASGLSAGAILLVCATQLGGPHSMNALRVAFGALSVWLSLFM
jgi:uncharacterized membrane protein (UPF0136 family)